MKRIIYTFIMGFAIIYSLRVQGQINLVPNPSFEDYIQCPNTLDDLSLCTGWSSFRESADYFNECSNISGIAPPNCVFGFQWPHSGIGYAGISTYSKINADYREIIGVQLKSPLQVGQKYFFSFFINMGGDKVYKVATNKMGIRFSSVSFSFSNPVPIDNYSQYYSDSIITDTLNWIQVKGSFIADSAYNYFMIGNFFNDSNTDTINTGQSNNTRSYYYIDDVCLSTDSIYTDIWTKIVDFSIKSEFLIYPNPSSGLITVNVETNEIESIRIIDNKGLIYYEKFKLNDKHILIDLTLFHSGIYFIEVKSKKEKKRDKFIILK